jgi:signal transduction histidine kinase
MDARNVRVIEDEQDIAEWLALHLPCPDSLASCRALRRESHIPPEINARPEVSMVHPGIGPMQRVLENLPCNAVRYTPRGGKIGLSLVRRPGHVAVVDTGCGIPEHEVDRTLDRFVRSGQGEEGLSDSPGLGLALVKRILERHGSRIAVTRAVNQGTRFEFDIPARVA